MTRLPPLSTLFPYTTLFRSLPVYPVPIVVHRDEIVVGADLLKLPVGLEQRLPVPEPHVLDGRRSEEHTSELQSQSNLVCRLLLEKKKKTQKIQDISIREK